MVSSLLAGGVAACPGPLGPRELLFHTDDRSPGHSLRAPNAGNGGAKCPQMPVLGNPGLPADEPGREVGRPGVLGRDVGRPVVLGREVGRPVVLGRDVPVALGDWVEDDVLLGVDVGDCVGLGDPEGLAVCETVGLVVGSALGEGDCDGSGVGVSSGCTASRTSWNSTLAAYCVVTVTRVSLPSGWSMTPPRARVRVNGAVHRPRRTTLMLVCGLGLILQGRE